ncbi:hypothetical protein RI054_02g11830 [Pseudoscourfieldia marina]
MAGPRRLACGLRRFARLCAAAAALLKQLQATTKLQLHDADDIYVEPTATEVNLTQVPVFQNMIMTEEQARDGVTVHMEGGGRDARLRSARRDRLWRLCAFVAPLLQHSAPDFDASMVPAVTQIKQLQGLGVPSVRLDVLLEPLPWDQCDRGFTSMASLTQYNIGEVLADAWSRFKATCGQPVTSGWRRSHLEPHGPPSLRIRGGWQVVVNADEVTFADVDASRLGGGLHARVQQDCLGHDLGDAERVGRDA